MRRIIAVLTLSLVMAAIMVASALPAFASADGQALGECIQSVGLGGDDTLQKQRAVCISTYGGQP